MDKAKLDSLLEKHKAQPAADGYIDIIVSRYNYKEFVSDLVTNDFKIESISWWEWCEDRSENKYGLGGPESIFFKGWFSEIPVSPDEFGFTGDKSKEVTISEILNRIETKTISFLHETATFKESIWMTPAIWLDVSNDWQNKYGADKSGF